jgi:predicted GIY-YIG superfamily endonuclease
MALVYGLHRINDATIRYVGLTTKSIERRFYEHQHSAKSGKNQPVYKWMRKYNDITFTVLANNLTKEEAVAKEIELIAFYEDLLNCTDGGDGLINPSIATRKKMSDAKKGKPASNQAIEAARLINTGRKMPPEFGEKTRQRLLGTKLSLETRLKISEATKGRIAHNKGKSPSIEVRAKMSKGQLNRVKLECPKCGTFSDPGNAKQWHFEKCKLAVKPPGLETK